MNTVSILTICAFLYLAFVTYLFGGKRGKSGSDGSDRPEPSASGGDEKEGRDEKPSEKSGRPLSIVPQSDFDMERFQQMLTASVAAAVTYVMKANIGDVSPNDVEFKGEPPGGQKEDNTEMSDDTPDMEDFNPGSVSPPATGDSIDEIEAALDVAANPRATPDEKAKAGNVLAGMQDVVFIGKLMSANDKINEGIMGCIAESMRNSRRKRPKGSPAPKRKGQPIDIDGSLNKPDTGDTN